MAASSAFYAYPEETPTPGVTPFETPTPGETPFETPGVTSCTETPTPGETPLFTSDENETPTPGITPLPKQTSNCDFDDLVNRSFKTSPIMVCICLLSSCICFYLHRIRDKDRFKHILTDGYGQKERQTSFSLAFLLILWLRMAISIQQGMTKPTRQNTLLILKNKLVSYQSVKETSSSQDKMTKGLWMDFAWCYNRVYFIGYCLLTIFFMNSIWLHWNTDQFQSNCALTMPRSEQHGHATLHVPNE